jgi:hypothetical protein
MRDAIGSARFRIISAAIVVIAVFVIAPHATASKELLLNGDLSKGSGGPPAQPDVWRTEAWINEPSTVSFTWTHPPNGAPGELEVNAIKPDDARWMESLTLAQGWYYFSAEIRTEDVASENTGATISIMEDGIVSKDLKGTTDWTRVGLYLKVGKKGADVEVALRVGGYASLNTGRAFFRNVSGIQVDAPPTGVQQIYDLDTIRKAAEPTPIGSPISLVLTYLFLLGVAYAGWYLFGMEPPKVSRAEARREAKKVARR